MKDDSRAELAGPARTWLGLSILSLVLAGLFALLLVLGRMPPFDRLVTDPGFFKRCLVVHVDLSLVVWFQAFLAGLVTLLPRRPGPDRRGRIGRALAVGGVLLVAATGILTSAPPVLSNYVPAIDHPAFLIGLVAFGAGLALQLLDARPRWMTRPWLTPRRMTPRASADATPVTDPRAASAEAGSPVDLPPAVRHGLRAAAFALLAAIATFAVTAAVLPAGLVPELRYELLFWGGGHVLQFASEAAMVSVWILLLAGALGRSPVSGRAAALGFGWLVAPLALAPFLALAGPEGLTYRLGFTRLMQWGIFPPVLLLLLLCVRSAWSSRRALSWNDPRVLGFATSAALTLLGFVLGALIRGSNTMVPAHYHAAIGAVTVAFMAATWVLLEPLGLRPPTGRRLRLAAWQPVLFGVGQSVFAIGFAIAGAHGSARKVYGAEQAARGLAETVGLTIMGLGGLVAVAGGLLFLGIVLAAWRDRAVQGARTWTTTWLKNPVASTPSSG